MPTGELTPTGASNERLREAVGDWRQLISARPVVLDDGTERGTRALEVRAAGSFHMTILVDRGMDIGPTYWNGYPLHWESPTGAVHPSYYNVDEWLRSFHGGLMFTAGLDNVGDPSVSSDGRRHSLHGRLSNLPATNVHQELCFPEGGNPRLVVRGTVTDAEVYGPHLRLNRTIEVELFTPRVTIRDVITNLGYQPCRAFLLYHFNLGFPLLRPGARLIFPAGEARPYDVASESGLEHRLVADEPSSGAAVEVFEHVVDLESDYRVIAGIESGHGSELPPLAWGVRYDRRDLPRLWHWRMMRAGHYVTGIEPANCGLAGASEAVTQSEGILLSPGETHEYVLTMAAGENQSDVTELLQSSD